ncbi:hypothetical protein PHYC_02375 [Phycisphaerales bacterium]|nr:hypothetical protein PHYC_02375 [Phycisphaerales bacterium]
MMALVVAMLAVANDVNSRLHDLARAESAYVEEFRVGTSAGGREIRGARLGAKTGESGPDDRASLVIVAGLNGMHRVGTEAAIALAEGLARDHKTLLDGATVYIVPCANPDTFAWHAGADHPKVEWPRTIRPMDADHDGRVNEDPAEDLNGDGIITMMRIRNPAPTTGLHAEFMIDPEDARLLKKPDAAKGERTEFALLFEGSDNDHDGAFNEDGVGGAGGGVDLDLNFPARWPEFADGAGRFALSEPETRALVEWMLGLKNVAAVLVFGPGDTLLNVPVPGKFDPSGQVPTGIEEGDKAAYEEIGKLFKEATGMTGAPALDNAGTFQGWAYAHYGVLSFQTPVWVRPDQVKTEDFTPKGEEQNAGEMPKAPAGEFTPDQIRDRMRQFRSATPEEQAKMLTEYQNLPPEQREKVQAVMREMFGEPPPAAQAPAPAANPEQPASAQPPATPQPGGPPGRRGGRRGGEGGGSGGGDSAAAKRPEPAGDDAKWMKYNDARVREGDATGFVEWAAFDHPQLGKVEIGGWMPGFKMNPPTTEIARLAGEQAKFVEALAAKFPKVTNQGPWVQRLGPALWRITARVTNEGWMATMPAIGVKARRAMPTLVSLEVPLERIVAGDRFGRAWAMAGSGGMNETSWTITGTPGEVVKINISPTIGPKHTIEATLAEVSR